MCIIYLLIIILMTLQKKTKKIEGNFKKPEGMHRELWGLLWTDNRYYLSLLW